MTPLWVDEDRIPYDEMWEDDRIWPPLLIAGAQFDGRSIFDGDSMVDHALDVISSQGPAD